MPPWSEYAASLFEAKVAEGKLHRRRRAGAGPTRSHILVPVFGMLLRRRAPLRRPRRLARPGRRAGSATGCPRGESATPARAGSCKLSPVTANGWLSILKVVCAAMTKHFELERTRPMPSSIPDRTHLHAGAAERADGAAGPRLPRQDEGAAPSALRDGYFGFITGRALRRCALFAAGPRVTCSGTSASSFCAGRTPSATEIMDQTKTALDQEIPLPPSRGTRTARARRGAPGGDGCGLDLPLPVDDRRHAIAVGARQAFPRSPEGAWLDDPTHAEGDAADVQGSRPRCRGARRRHPRDLRPRTERMQRHYSTAQREEMRQAVGKVISLAVEREKRRGSGRKRRAT